MNFFWLKRGTELRATLLRASDIAEAREIEGPSAGPVRLLSALHPHLCDGT
jgi:hypothetical protein